jgi:hypothetical protein
MKFPPRPAAGWMNISSVPVAGKYTGKEPITGLYVKDLKSGDCWTIDF